ncbi:MAG: hypothetical protein RLY16_724 [Bacteroidota bacterium]
MRFLIFLCFLVGACFNVSAQQRHFIYLQTDNKQPFYVKMDKKILNSTLSGYLIIPKLEEGSYTLLVGFPKGEWPEQRLMVDVKHQDEGWLLKNFGEKGWGLFNMHTFQVLMASNNAAAEKKPKEVNASEFSSMLSDAVNDPAIRQAEPPVVVAPKVQPLTPVQDSPKVAPKTEPVTAVPTTTAQTVVEPAAENPNESIFNYSEIKKVLDVKTDSTQEAIYIVRQGTQIDTVVVNWQLGKIIQLNQVPTAEIPKDSAMLMVPTALDTVSKVAQEIKAEPVKTTDSVQKEVATVVASKPAEEKFIPIEVPNPNSEPVKDSVAVVDGKLAINSNCTDAATEEDYLRLRKKLAGETDEDKMLAMSKKVFKSKCFTTEQIKNLAVLFINDQGKYAFFDAAYPFVSDTFNFHHLQSLLSDDYYISRFKAMIRR